MLKVKDIHTYYGDSYILQGVSLEIKERKAVALLGRNGMGKTTTINSIIGFTPPRSGSILFRGAEINNLEQYKIPRMGIGLVPQGRRIFSSLTVKENLSIAADTRGKKDPWTLERIYQLFPILSERSNMRGTLLSGGEQQMLAIARILMTNPQLILMDEPSEGLSPLLVTEVAKIIQELKKSGLSILLVEQNLKMALSIADYVYIVSKGKIVYESTPKLLWEDEEAKRRHLGVGEN
jgi:branched-chain amino acid transport system ATP-binding protein